MTVAVGLWPLAQLVQAVGQGNVRVVDVVPAGQDPTTYHLSGAAVGRVRSAGLVVYDGTLQPSLRSAARGAAHAVDVGDGDGDFWLNPYRMEVASRAVAKALIRVDPRARSTFSNGSRDEVALVSSLDQDYQSTLGVCPATTMVTSDEAFAALNGRYQLHVVAIDGATPAPLRPDAATVAREVAVIRRAHVKAVFDDVWQPIDGLIPAEGETGAAIRKIDPLTGVPPEGWPRGLHSYFGLMEYDLQTIAGALGCPSPDETQ